MIPIFFFFSSMVKISNQLTRVVHTLKYFTQNDWVWTNHNSAAIQAALSESDKKVTYKDLNHEFLRDCDDSQHFWSPVSASLFVVNLK